MGTDAARLSGLSVRHLVVLALAACGLVAPAAATAQDVAGVGGVADFVVSASGAPEVAVTVCLAGTTRCAITAADGRFRLADLRPASYELEVTPPGQATLVGTVVDVRAGLDTIVEVTLSEVAALEQMVTVTAPAFIPPEEIKT